jgi:hypothetical protein
MELIEEQSNGYSMIHHKNSYETESIYSDSSRVMSEKCFLTKRKMPVVNCSAQVKKIKKTDDSFSHNDYTMDLYDHNMDLFSQFDDLSFAVDPSTKQDSIVDFLSIQGTNSTPFSK